LEFLVYDGNKTFVEDTNKKEDGVVMCVDVPDTGEAEVTVRMKQPNPQCTTYYQVGKFTGYNVDPAYSDDIEMCNGTLPIEKCFNEGTAVVPQPKCIYKKYPRLYSDVDVTYEPTMKTHAISSATCGLRDSNPTPSSKARYVHMTSRHTTWAHRLIPFAFRLPSVVCFSSRQLPHL
jgi:hypothetical protein